MSWQSSDKLHSKIAAWPHQQLRPLAELNGVLALTSMEQELEQEAAAAPAPASAPAPSHASTACQHHVQTVVGRMWDMDADNLEVQRSRPKPATRMGQHMQGLGLWCSNNGNHGVDINIKQCLPQGTLVPSLHHGCQL